MQTGMQGATRTEGVTFRRMAGSLSSCPRCSAPRSVPLKKDGWGVYLDCLSCGWHGYLESIHVQAPGSGGDARQKPPLTNPPVLLAG